MQRQRPFLVLSLCLVIAALSGCAHRGSRSPDARPVLYPNATYKQMGADRSKEELDLCIAAARDAELTPDEKDNAVGHGAARGAAVVGTAAAVGSMVRGNGAGGAVRAAVGGAAIGGAAGAVGGAFNERPNMTYRNFVQRCAREKGLDVIGWQ